MVGTTISHYKILEKPGLGSSPPKEVLEMASDIGQILLPVVTLVIACVHLRVPGQQDLHRVSVAFP